MGDTTQELYVVAAEDADALVHRAGYGQGASPRILSVFSSRELAPRLTRKPGNAQRDRPANSREVGLKELRQILLCARDEGCTHVTLDGREMRIDGFSTLLDHEQLE